MYFCLALAAFLCYIGYIIFEAEKYTAFIGVHYVNREWIKPPEVKTPSRELIIDIKEGRFQPLVVEWPSFKIRDGVKRFWALKPDQPVPAYFVNRGEPIDDLICPKCGITGLQVPQSVVQKCPHCNETAWAETLVVFYQGRWTRVQFSGRNGKWTAAVDGHTARGRTRTTACSNLRQLLSSG
jgi:hypothetical protein